MQSIKSGYLYLFLLIIVCFVGAGALDWLLGALRPILLALFIIYFLQPFVNNLQRVSSLPRWICILLSFLVILFLLLFFIFLLFPRLKSILSLDYSQLLPYFPLEKLLQYLLSPLVRYSTSAIQWTGNWGMSLCLAFYALLDCYDLCQTAANCTKKLFPSHYACPLLNILDILDTTCWSYLRGRLYTCVILFIFSFICFWLLNLFFDFQIPFPILLAFIIATTNLIPILGPFLGTAFCIIFSLQNNFPTILAILSVCLATQALDNLWLTPRLGTPFGLKPFWTMAGVIFFGSLWGVLGIFLAVPLCAAFSTLWHRYNKNPQFLFQCPCRFKSS